MSKSFRGWKIDEVQLLPASVQDYVPSGHLSRLIVSVVRESLDLSAIEASYASGLGQPPFDPRLMTALLLHGYASGLYSSRRLARASVERADFMMIVAGDPPDFRTISEFRRRHLEALAGLFVQVLRLAEVAGLVKLGHVALDGTKIKANASKHKAMSYERMKADEQRLQREIEELLKRADAAGALVLVPTIDSAGKSKRPRDIKNGVKVPFKIGPKTFFQVATSPAWAMALRKTGMLRTENIVPYTEGRATRDSTAQTMQVKARGSHTWDELARLRDRWKRAFVVKGVLHPEDAERLVSLGVDGLIVSNHGGRHFDGAPASVDMLPAIVAVAGTRATVMIDSGIRSGLDILRAAALGARAAFAGRPFLYGLGALGEPGARHVMEMFADELRTEMKHVGIQSLADAHKITVRHPGAWLPV